MLDLKSIRVISVSGKTTDQEGQSEMFLARAKRQGYGKFLAGKETVSTSEEYDDAVAESDKS